MRHPPRKRVPVEGEGNPPSLDENPFSMLQSDGLPQAPVGSPPEESRTRRAKPGNRPMIYIQRERSGRGGKTVTVCTGFTGIHPEGLQELARRMRIDCGTGGTVRGQAVELQGDCRDRVQSWLERDGYPTRRSGG